MKHAMRILGREEREIQESSDSVRVQRVHLPRRTRETHRDEWRAPKDVIALPAIQWKRREQLVLAHHHVRRALARALDGFTDADGGSRIHADLGEIPREMLGDESVARDTQRVEMCHANDWLTFID